jgi:hypothetical protein
MRSNKVLYFVLGNLQKELKQKRRNAIGKRKMESEKIILTKRQ